MTTSYSRLVTSYRLGMELTGFASALERYIRRLPIQMPLNARILDAGCGTGTLGIAMKQAFPQSSVLATDLEEKFFANIRTRVRAYNFSSSEFNLGIADINSPEKVLQLDPRTHTVLNPGTFDAVVTGAVLGYSDNPEQSILKLLNLVKAGGYFIDIEMSENIIGRTLSNFFTYKNPGIERITNLLRENNCVVEQIPFALTECSAGLSRVGLLARKSF